MTEKSKPDVLHNCPGLPSNCACIGLPLSVSTRTIDATRHQKRIYRAYMSTLIIIDKSCLGRYAYEIYSDRRFRKADSYSRLVGL